MKTLILCLICASAIPKLPAGDPLPAADAMKKVETAQIATVIVNGKEFKLLIAKSGDKDSLCEAVKKAGLNTINKEDSKAAKKVGWEIMAACLKGNFILVESPPPKAK